MTRSRLSSYLWKLLVSLGLILLLLRFVSGRELMAIPGRIRWPFLFGYFGLNLVDRLIMAYKWKILLDSKKVPCTWGRLIVVYFQGTFWGNLFPTSLGGDAVRVYELTRNGGAAADVISSVIMERFIGFLSSAIMALMVAPFLFFLVPSFPPLLLWLLILFLATGILLLLLLMRGNVPPTLHRFLARLPWTSKITPVTASFVLYGRHPRALTRFFLWSFGEQIIPLLTFYFLALTLDLPLPLSSLVLIVPMAQFFARIPISLSGFGVQEGVFVTLFSFFRLSSTHAFALGFASNLGNLLIGLPGAFFYLKEKPGSSSGTAASGNFLSPQESQIEPDKTQGSEKEKEYF